MEIGQDKTKVMTNNPYRFQNRDQVKRSEDTVSGYYRDQSSLMKDQNPRFFQDSPDNISSFETEEHMEGQEHLVCFKG